MLNTSRWNRINEIEVDFNYIKRLTKKYFDYEIQEACTGDFCKNIKKYKELDENKLLNVIEKNAYKRLIVLSMRALVNNPQHPVINELTNDTFKELFKQRNRINIKNNETYNGSLDNCYKVTYYNEDDCFVEIKMARVKDYEEEYNNNPGITLKRKLIIYDCCKFIIDLNQKLIFMFYNDVSKTNIGQGKEVTDKKKSFYELFTKATQGNILAYIIHDSLNKYFLDYMNEIEANDPKKMISIIETSNMIIGRKATRSTSIEYVHERETIDAMKRYILTKGYHVSLLECKINSELIKLKGTGELFIESTILTGEVFKNVCKEFFNGHGIYELCTQ